jgi:nicotinamidase-related amidase
VLDFSGVENPAKGPCSTQRGGRCIATIPAMKGLIASARARKVLVVYSVSPNGAPADIAAELKPASGDPVVKASADKFVGTDLGKILSDKGIKTVIVTGTVSEGAVLDTATNAAFRGLKVIVPVDGMSSADLYPEQYVAWHLTHAPGVSAATTLTRIGLISF